MDHVEAVMANMLEKVANPRALRRGLATLGGLGGLGGVAYANSESGEAARRPHNERVMDAIRMQNGLAPAPRPQSNLSRAGQRVGDFYRGATRSHQDRTYEAIRIARGLE